MNDRALLMIPQASPKIHPGRVKLEKREKGLNTKETTTLSSWFTHSPLPPRAMPVRVFLRVYARGWVKR